MSQGVLSPILAATSKEKKRVGPGEGDRHGHGTGEESGGLHECQLVCEKMLSSRNHCCKEGAHTGRWPDSLWSSFEEVCIHVRSVGSGRVLIWAI